jgi:membrane associated rhomboid family serine protease
LIQFLNGTAAVAVSTTGGIAHWAHIGGFLAGVFVVCVIRRK